jgi:hypothetical protein
VCSSDLLNINGILTADSTSVNVLKPITIASVLTLQGGLIYSVSTGSVGIMPTLYTKSTYVLDGTALTTTNVVVLGAEGQSVTFIAAGNVDIDASNIAGVSANFRITDNGTLTLRRVGGSWYVISHANTTLTF